MAASDPLTSRPVALTLGLRARLISDAGRGLLPFSEVRKAIEKEALKHLRAVAGISEADPHDHGQEDDEALDDLRREHG